LTMSEPKISVIIPTLNAGGKIEQCLEAVFTQSVVPCEVIIVDGRSRDDTVQRARKFPVKLFFQDYGACGAARQIGLDNAQGDYVAFTDADCIPSRDWLKNLVRELDDPEIVGVGGGIQNIGEALWVKSINLAQDTFIGGGGSIQTRYFKEKRFVKSISASNMVFRKQDLIDIGGFNIHLSGSDEVELNRRIVKLKKGKLLYVPDALILHDHRRDLKQFARNMYYYGRWRRESGVWDLPVVPPLIAPLLLLTLLISKWVLIGIIAAYAGAIGATGLLIAIRERNPRFLISIPVIFIVEHSCYMLGFWRELLFPRKKPQIAARQST